MNLNPNDHPKVNIVNNNELQCILHRLPVVNFAKKTGASFAHTIHLQCALCPKSSFLQSNIRKITPKIMPGGNGYVLLFNDMPKLSEDPALKSKPTLNYLQHEIEAFIFDKSANGYAPRNIISIPDQHVLVAASINGFVTLYSMGDVVEHIFETQILRTIRCVKYVPLSSGKRYVMFGTEKEVYVYALQNQKLEYVKMLDNGVEVNDIAYIEDEHKMLTIGNDNNIRVWDLATLEFERKIDTEQFGVQGPLCTLIYIQDKKKLAIEHRKGFCVISLKKDLDVNEKEAPDHYLVPDRYGTGLGYIPKTHTFVLRVSRSEYSIINAKTFHPISTVSGLTAYAPETPGIRFISNHDGTQIVCNSNTSYFSVQQNSLHSVSQSVDNFLEKTSGIEAIPDQYRLILADERSGRIIVYRLNQTTASSALQNSILNSLLSNPRPPPKTWTPSIPATTNPIVQTTTSFSFKPSPQPTIVTPATFSPAKIIGTPSPGISASPVARRKRDQSKKLQRKLTEIVIKKRPQKKSTSRSASNKREKSAERKQEKSVSRKSKKSPKNKQEQSPKRSPKRKEEQSVEKNAKKSPKRSQKSTRIEEEEEKTSSKAISVQKKEDNQSGLIEVVREKKDKGKKNEKVWIVFETAEEDTKRGKQAQRGRKTTKKGSGNGSDSQDRSRSRTKSKSKGRK